MVAQAPKDDTQTLTHIDITNLTQYITKMRDREGEEVDEEDEEEEEKKEWEEDKREEEEEK
jgi:predicted lipid-binding transport protein (Tim44 family)